MTDADAEGLDDGDALGLPLDGDALGREAPPEPLPDPLPEPLPEPLPAPPVEGEEVGDEDEGDDAGEEVGEGGAARTGGATLGGAALPVPCFHAHPTEPPAGTVREPELEDE